MAPLRSRRLEALLGALVADASYGQVAGLASAKAPEDFDLDFKSKTYKPSDEGKRNLSIDVAAMANTAGGLIILGMEEDDQARALKPVEDFAVTDAEVNRMSQIVAAGVGPLPSMDIRIVENEEKPGTGFYLIAVPRSLTAPHAVLVNDSLRFPRRNGRTTAYLSEPEVAQAYRERFAGLQSRLDVAEVHERFLLERLNTDLMTYVVLTLVPDQDGHVEINYSSFNAFRTAMLNRDPMQIYPGTDFKRAFVGPDRLMTDAGYGDHRMDLIAFVLHRTGAGSFAAAVDRRREDSSSSDIEDEYLTARVISGLQFLAKNARDRAAAGGSVSLRATLVPVTPELPARLVHSRNFGSTQTLGGTISLVTPPVATTLADLDDLASDGPQLLTTTFALVSGLKQQFGYPEALQVSADGHIRIKYWTTQIGAALQSWAEQNSVEVTEDTVN
ncbi:ATP-binding protein [Amycolatopsis sp. NPDC051371]|uniref:AlbA family DNA-binding domain-containing protein n=1 Tax=Amycolatopsis sp. NPDC051371 TaxID=3155800 RepID=UPI003415EEF0